MFSDTLAALARASGGRLVRGRPEALITSIFSDTRVPGAGGLFVALRGERFDGNQFARDAVALLGAAAVLVDRPEAVDSLPADAGAILVEDARAGYLGIAAAHRSKLTRVLWFGVTGSVGKSTTKEMLAHILETGAGWNVCKAKGSFNNAVGLSHTILSVNAEHRAAVLELGTNHPGEIRPLAAAARPQIAIITNAGPSHLEAFGSVEAVAREKAEILSHQTADDVAVLNSDDPHVSLWRELARGRICTFGLQHPADVRAHELLMDECGCARFRVRSGGAEAQCKLAVPGVHQAANALAALTAALSAGIPLETATAALATFTGVKRRFAVKRVPQPVAPGFTLIDDAYNANPASFKAALQTMACLPGRRFVVAGDMLELGSLATEYHRELGALLAASNLELLVTVGMLAAVAGEAAVAAGLSAARCVACAQPEDAAALLRPRLQAGDVVLVKGSHGVHLERCCEALEALSH